MRHVILIAALGAAIGVSFGGTASAAAPQTVRIDVDSAGAPVDCGSYSLDQHVFGRLILREFVQNGELVRTLENFALRHTWTNPDTGESLSYPDVGATLFVIHSDGSATLAIIGISARVVVPGQGIVAAELGREELFFTDRNDTDPDITISGMHDPIPEALCAPLAPPA